MALLILSHLNAEVGIGQFRGHPAPGGPFDEANLDQEGFIDILEGILFFAHSGGEDLAFFTQLAQNGASMVWANSAIVHEEVPENRTSKAWLKTRVVGIANSRVRVMQMLKPGLFNSFMRGAKTVALAIQASLYTLAGFISPTVAFEAEQLRWKFTGKLTAHFNRKTTRPEGH